MTAVWPGDSATVVNRVRSALKQVSADGEVSVDGLERVKVSAELVGTDLNHLTLDATNVKLHFTVADHSAATPQPSGGSEPEAPEPALRQSGIAKDFRFVARPMHIQRTPVTVDVRLFDTPILWLTFAEPADTAVPDSVHALTPDEDLESVRGTFHASIRTRDIAPLITSVARPLLEEGGLRLGRVRLTAAGDGGDGIRISASAGVRWKLLMASARADAQVVITPDAVITIRDFTVGSRNPLIKFALLFVRKQVRAIVGRSIDLNESMADGGTNLRVHDVRVSADDQLSVEGRIG